MDNKTKSKILSIVLISLLSIVILIFVISIFFRFVIGPPIDPTLDENIEKLSVEEVIQVNVLNACGVKGLAATTRNYLRARGFDVVDIGNYKSEVDTSFVIDRMGDISSAKKVAYALGISDSLVISKIDSNLFLRGSVILGRDYKRLKPFQ
ncbi:LytR C-terminal domain-containing protein [Bacteroidota bacterium]